MKTVIKVVKKDPEADHEILLTVQKVVALNMIPVGNSFLHIQLSPHAHDMDLCIHTQKLPNSHTLSSWTFPLDSVMLRQQVLISRGRRVDAHMLGSCMCRYKCAQRKNKYDLWSNFSQLQAEIIQNWTSSQHNKNKIRACLT